MDYILSGYQPPQRAARCVKMHGLTVLKGFYSLPRLRAIEIGVRKYLEAPGPAVLDYPFLQTYRAYPEDMTDALLRVFYQNDYFAEVAESFFRNPYYFPAKCYITVSKPGTDKSVLPYCMHFDNVHFLKFFLHITDVREYGGAIEIAPGTHIENRQYREAQIGKGYDHVGIDTGCNGQPIPIVTDPGDLIIFDTDVSHNAGADGDRLAIQVLGMSKEVAKWRAYGRLPEEIERIDHDTIDPLRGSGAG